MKKIARILLLFPALAFIFFSCIKDDTSDCPEDRFALRFTFTHHDETDLPTDLFAEKVNDVDVYIFDMQDNYVHHVSTTQSSLTGGNTLYLDLEEGGYKIVAWGNLRDAGYGVDTQERTRGEFTVSALVSDPQISDLFHGLAEVALVEPGATEELSLTRNTHLVRIHMLGLPEPTRMAPGTDYSVRIEGSNNIYDFENNPVASSPTTYIPTYLTSRDPYYTVTAEFKVQRLFMDGDMTLKIYNRGALDRSDDITNRILTAYEGIGTIDDLDRQYLYELYYELGPSGDWVFVGNNVIDWEGPHMPGEL